MGFWDHQYWWARKDKEYSLYDYTGKIVVQKGWKKIIPPIDQVAVVKTGAGWKYIRPDFSVILQLSADYEWVELFREGFAAVKRENAWGFINSEGEEVIRATFEKVQSFSCGLVAVMVNTLWGYINPSGVIVIHCKYIGATSFRNDKAWVSDCWCSWYINKKGEAISAIKVSDYL